MIFCSIITNWTFASEHLHGCLERGINFWFHVCVLTCHGVYSRERLWKLVFWVEEKLTIFSCFLFASLSCLRAFCAEGILLASTSSQREENRLGITGLPDQWEPAGFWIGLHTLIFPPSLASFISRAVSGWELFNWWIGGGIERSPCSLEVGVCSPRAVLYCIFLAPVHRFHRQKTTTQALFSRSCKDFWSPVSCSHVVLHLSLQGHILPVFSSWNQQCLLNEPGSR